MKLTGEQVLEMQSKGLSVDEIGALARERGYQMPDNRSALDRASGILGKVFPGAKALGGELGKAAYGVGQLVRGDVAGAAATGQDINIPKAVGGAISSGATAAGFAGAGTTGTFSQRLLSSIGLGSAIAGGEQMAKGGDVGDVAKSTVAG